MSGQALAEIGQGGQQTAPGFQNLSVNCLPRRAVHVRRCCLDRECDHRRSARRLFHGGARYLPRPVGRSGLQWSGTRPDQNREPRSPHRDPDPVGDRRLSERDRGRAGAHGQPRSGPQRRRGALRLCQRQRRHGLQRSRLRGIGVGLLTANCQGGADLRVPTLPYRSR